MGSATLVAWPAAEVGGANIFASWSGAWEPDSHRIGSSGRELEPGPGAARAAGTSIEAMSHVRLLSLLAFLPAPFAPVAAAQQPPATAVAPAAADDEVDDEALEVRITAACAAAREAGTLVAAKALAAQLVTATTCEMPSVPVRQQALAPTELFAAVRPSTRIVGHYYKCKECGEWHFSGASGFCIDDHGGVATCAHVIAPDDSMGEAFLVVADLRGNVWPVQKVAAAAAVPDVCVLQTSERGTVPLPLRASVRTGEAVWCLSHPDHQFGFFSAGLVARRYLLRESEPAKTDEKHTKPDLSRPATAWLNVTCDFAKGSSGAPVVDAAGNVVGIAQSTSTVVYDESATPVDTQMVFKNAAPAAALQALGRARDAR